MSPALPAVPARTVLRALTSVGFVHVSTKGSHARGTLGSILRQAGLSGAEFRALL